MEGCQCANKKAEKENSWFRRQAFKLLEGPASLWQERCLSLYSLSRAPLHSDPLHRAGCTFTSILNLKLAIYPSNVQKLALNIFSPYPLWYMRCIPIYYIRLYFSLCCSLADFDQFSFWHIPAYLTMDHSMIMLFSRIRFWFIVQGSTSLQCQAALNWNST